MSQTFSEQLSELEAKLSGQLATITTDVSDVASGIAGLQTALATALAGLQPGNVIQQSDLDAFNAVSSGLTAQAAALESAVAATVIPPAPTPEPPPAPAA